VAHLQRQQMTKRIVVPILVLVALGLLAAVPGTAPGAGKDEVAPTTPRVRLLTSSSHEVVVGWRRATDNVAVTGYRVYRAGVPLAVVRPGRRTYAFRGLACGTSYRLAVQARDAAGNRSRRSNLVAATRACGNQVVVAVGDLCLSGSDCAATSSLVDQIAPARVLTLGDHAYPDGTLEEYMGAYEAVWGRHKAKTSPTPGNHDYGTPGARGYFDYFGARAPGEYYSFELGAWHVISLDSEISVRTGSDQWTWLRADLARHPNRCILAYWHTPRFSSGRQHRLTARFLPFWTLLHAAGADVVLNAHEHNYERFAPQNPTGGADPNGIRQFVVGTGGASLLPLGPPVANSEARSNTTFGVVKLVLRDGGYDWSFLPVAGATFTDGGSDTC
jgi:hypothetical protein